MSIRDNLGGGSVLDSIEEIAANTEPGKHAGALAVKELSESLGEDVNGMTVHEKLDYIMENSSLTHNLSTDTKLAWNTTESISFLVPAGNKFLVNGSYCVVAGDGSTLPKYSHEPNIVHTATEDTTVTLTFTANSSQAVFSLSVMYWGK